MKDEIGGAGLSSVAVFLIFSFSPSEPSHDERNDVLTDQITSLVACSTVTTSTTLIIANTSGH